MNGQLKAGFEATDPRDMTPLIGREHELSLLLDRWAQAKTGEGQVVLLSGEPGIGKSRIAQALRARTSDGPQMRLRYQCSPYRTNSALHPVIGQLEFAAGIVPEDSPERKLAKLRRSTGEVGQQCCFCSAVIASMMSISLCQRYSPLGSDAASTESEDLRSIDRPTLGLAAQPVLMIMEDAHWIDPTTSELFRLVIEQIHRLPVLLVITFRPEFHSPWGHSSHVTSLVVNRLPRQHCMTMVETITAGKALPSEMLHQIVTKTDGVPLFVEELTKTLLELGVLKQESDHYVLNAPLPSVAIPDTLQDC